MTLKRQKSTSALMQRNGDSFFTFYRVKRYIFSVEFPHSRLAVGFTYISTGYVRKRKVILEQMHILSGMAKFINIASVHMLGFSFSFVLLFQTGFHI